MFVRLMFMSASACPLTRNSAFRTPSRLRNKMVLSMSSNWIAAAPNALGEARRNKAWFSAKVKNREKSWSAIREDAEDMEELSNRLAEFAELAITLDVE